MGAGYTCQERIQQVVKSENALTEAALAHEKLGGRETVGKVLLIPGR